MLKSDIKSSSTTDPFFQARCATALSSCW